MRALAATVVVALATVAPSASADVVPSSEEEPRPAAPTPSRETLRDVRAVVGEGLASWYGGRFHGQLTASGEPFDQREMTAAHPTLPFGSLLVVTNLDNGLRTILRVNDRGPFVAGRVVDCSAAAADVLGFREAGLACVRLELFDHPQRVLLPASAAGNAP